MLHLLLHFLIPIAISLFVDRNPRANAKRIAWMLLGIAIDLDHLLANPIYDPNRCSIGFHPLHHPYLGLLYLALVYPRPTRWLGIGLSFHMVWDAVDCFL